MAGAVPASVIPTGDFGAIPSAFVTAEMMASRTAEASRKRTSRFVGWTLTSTSVGGKSTKSTTTGFLSPSSGG